MTALRAISCMFLLLAAAGAQQAAKPAESSPQDDYSGMYTFLQEGEFVQITLQDAGRVDGYISRLGDLESDRGVPLDHFFKSGSLKDGQLIFTTQAVHGVSFEFKGTFDRGPAKSKSEQGYYLLKGTLTQLTTDATKKTVAKSREVEFKLFPEDVEGAPPKRD